jgi:hypothetical protein
MGALPGGQQKLPGYMERVNASLMPARIAREIAFKPQGIAAPYSALWAKLVL